MGKKGSILVPFLIEGLQEKSYGRYLTGDINNIIQIILPRKTKNLCCESMKILKDWNFKKGRTFEDENDYTKAKQGMLAALRRSDYLDRVEELKPKLCYRILNSKEIKEKKWKLKERKRVAQVEELQSPLSVESGYESSIESSPITNLSHEIEIDYASDQDLLGYDSGIDSPPYFDELQLIMESISLMDEPLFPVSECVSAASHESDIPSGSILDAVKHDHDFGFPSDAGLNQDALIEDTCFNNEVSSVEEILAGIQTRYLEKDFPILPDSVMDYLLDDLSPCSSLSFDDINDAGVEQMFRKARVLRFKSEQMLGGTTLITCEPKDEEVTVSRSVFNLVPLNEETSCRLQLFQVVEVKEVEDSVWFLFSDNDFIALGNDISKRLVLSQITEVKRLGDYVLFFLNPQKCFGSN